MTKILYITPFFNYPPRDGASLRSVRLFESLIKKNTVDVLTYKNDSVNSKVLEKYSQSTFYFFNSSHRKVNSLSFLNRLFSKELPGFASHDPQSIANDIDQLINKNGHYDVIYFATQLMGQSKIWMRSNTHSIIDLYDIYYSYSESKLKGLKFYQPFYWLFLLESIRVKIYEKKIINLFDKILVTCKENLKAIKSLGPIGHVIEVPNGTNIPTNVKIKNGDSILMVANFEYAGNFEGIKWFYDFVWPFLKSNKKYQLDLVGKYPEKLANLVNGDPQISIKGLVPHLDSYYENSRCVIIPLFNDGGTKTKLIEAIAFGVPIVATKIGAKGFENLKTITISDHPEKFAKSIQKIFETKYPTIELMQGMDKIRNQFSWDIIGDELNRVLSRQVA